MADERCPHCAGVVERTDRVCPHCQRSLTGKAAIADAAVGLVTGMPTGGGLLLVVAVIAAAVGVLSVSEATAGVAGITAGCFLAICARIAQAATHHREAMRARRD